MDMEVGSVTTTSSVTGIEVGTVTGTVYTVNNYFFYSMREI